MRSTKSRECRQVLSEIALCEQNRVRRLLPDETPVIRVNGDEEWVAVSEQVGVLCQQAKQGLGVVTDDGYMSLKDGVPGHERKEAANHRLGGHVQIGFQDEHVNL